MRYQRIYSQIWHDEKFTQLSDDAKYLFLYILTSPHSNSIGIYVLPKGYICEDLGWDMKRLGKPFAELLNKGLILYDEKVRLVCIRNHIKHNPIENQNQVKSAQKTIAQLPVSPLFETIFKQLTKPYHKPLLKLLQKRYAKPETETETKTETKEKTKDICSKCLEFYWQEFWSEYPHRVAKKKAYEIFSHLDWKDKTLFPSLMEGLRKWKQTDQWQRDGGKYIPYPATWLNQRRWEDEVKIENKGGFPTGWRKLLKEGGILNEKTK